MGCGATRTGAKSGLRTLGVRPAGTTVEVARRSDLRQWAVVVAAAAVATMAGQCCLRARALGVACGRLGGCVLPAAPPAAATPLATCKLMCHAGLACLVRHGWAHSLCELMSCGVSLELSLLGAVCLRADASFLSHPPRPVSCTPSTPPSFLWSPSVQPPPRVSCSRTDFAVSRSSSRRNSPRRRRWIHWTHSLVHPNPLVTLPY